MKLPARINLDLGVNKKIVQNMIDSYGIARDLNEIALTVYCKNEHGQEFEIVQFHSSRNFVSIGGLKIS